MTINFIGGVNQIFFWLQLSNSYVGGLRNANLELPMQS